MPLFPPPLPPLPPPLRPPPPPMRRAAARSRCRLPRAGARRLHTTGGAPARRGASLGGVWLPAAPPRRQVFARAR
eukprot:5906525-Prymnesium_polylepis.1